MNTDFDEWEAALQPGEQSRRDYEATLRKEAEDAQRDIEAAKAALRSL